ncbi:putative UPF0496 protein 2, partial [Asparagus officinalis]|uniref:putative UPF0496 protein 2 n=1 Tax=Asparagus officinalis TaxID=4686 RepID=UPI00098E6E0E
SSTAIHHLSYYCSQQQEYNIKPAQPLQRTFSSPLCNADHASSDFPLESIQESLLPVATSCNSTSSRLLTHLNSLFFNFFETNAQATAACISLLSSIKSARSHHQTIHRLLPSSSPSALFQLSSLLKLDNPLSPKALSCLHSIRSHYPALIRSLTSADQKISRLLKLYHLTRNASYVALVALSAAVAAMVVIASHGAAAVAVAPVATAGISLKGRTGKWFRGWKRIGAKVDVAAKGAYIVGRDLDTLSQMAMTAHDDIENGRGMARMVVEKREWEVVKEMERRGEMGLGLEEHLQELEEHVYLCLTSINRSWRLVAQELVDM